MLHFRSYLAHPHIAKTPNPEKKGLAQPDIGFYPVVASLSESILYLG